MERVAIGGNTFPVKDELKALGARWDAERKAWMVPASQADKARALVAGAPASNGRSGASSFVARKTCVACGHVERRNSRGYVEGDRILRSGECQSCYEERKQGY